MRIEQEKVFRPITITLETQEEAEDFFNLIEKVESHRHNPNINLSVDSDERKIIASLISFMV